MKPRSWLAVCLVALAATLLGGLSAPEHRAMPGEQVAARYHLRQRTSKFFQRAARPAMVPARTVTVAPR